MENELQSKKKQIVKRVGSIIYRVGVRVGGLPSLWYLPPDCELPSASFQVEEGWTESCFSAVKSAVLSQEPE